MCRKDGMLPNLPASVARAERSVARRAGVLTVARAVVIAGSEGLVHGIGTRSRMVLIYLVHRRWAVEFAGAAKGLRRRVDGLRSNVFRDSIVGLRDRGTTHCHEYRSHERCGRRFF